MRKYLSLLCVFVFCLCVAGYAETDLRFQLESGYAYNILGGYLYFSQSQVVAAGIAWADYWEFMVAVNEDGMDLEWPLTLAAEVRLSPKLGFYRPYLGCGIVAHTISGTSVAMGYVSLSLLRFSVWPRFWDFPDDVLISLGELRCGPFYPVLVQQVSAEGLDWNLNMENFRLGVSFVNITVRF